jgi:hypothetical protein
MPAYDSVRGQLVRLQAELLNILEHMVVAQRRTNFWAPWCVYFHDCLASRTLSGCVVAFILFCDEVEGCIGVYTEWHESKAEIFHQVQYRELAMFRELAEWATHPFLADQEFQVQYARFLADTIARCWVWTTGPQ